MQTKFLIMVVALVVCLCILFFILVKCMGNRPFFTKLKNMAKKELDALVWNGVIRTVIQCYLDFSMVVCLMYMIADDAPNGQKTKLTGYVLTAVLLAIPVFFIWLMYHYRSRLEELKPKIGVLYVDYDVTRMMARHYFIVFLIRRIGFSFISVYAGPWDGGMVLTINLLIFYSYQAYLLVAKPHLDKRAWQIEVVSEILVCYCIMGTMFCESEPNPLYKYYLGWIAVGSILFLILIHLGNMMKDSAKAAVMLFRNLYFKIKIKIAAWRKKKEEKNENESKVDVAPKDQPRTERPMMHVIKEEEENKEREDYEAHLDKVIDLEDLGINVTPTHVKKKGSEFPKVDLDSLVTKQTMSVPATYKLISPSPNTEAENATTLFASPEKRRT